MLRSRERFQILMFSGLTLLTVGVGSLFAATDELSPSEKKEVAHVLNQAAVLVQDGHGSEALEILKRLNLETGYFSQQMAVHSPDPLTRRFMALYHGAFIQNYTEGYLNRCAGNVGSLRKRSEIYSESIAKTEMTCANHRNSPILGDLSKILSDTRMLLESPQSDPNFISHFLSASVDQTRSEFQTSKLKSANPSSFSGAPKIDPRVQRAQDQEKNEKDHIEYNVTRGSSDEYDQFVKESLGIFSGSPEAPAAALRARTLHLELMQANRENCLSNYLFFTHSFDFSGQAESPSKAVSSLFTSSLKLFGNAPGESKIPDHDAAGNPRYYESELVDYGKKALGGFEASRKGRAPYTLDQVYQALLLVFEASGKERVLQIKNNPFRFLFESENMRAALQSKTAPSEAVLKGLIRQSLKDSIQKARDYAAQIRNIQETKNGLGEDRSTFDYSKSGALLLYSSPLAIQKVLMANPHLVGVLCESMKKAKENYENPEIPAAVELMAGGANFVPVVGTTAGAAIGLGMNAYLYSEAASRYFELEKAKKFSFQGEKKDEVDEEMREGDLKGIRIRQKELGDMQKTALVSIPAAMGTGALASGALHVAMKKFPSLLLVPTFTKDALETYATVAGTQYVVTGSPNVSPEAFIQNFSLLHLGRLAERVAETGSVKDEVYESQTSAADATPSKGKPVEQALSNSGRDLANEDKTPRSDQNRFRIQEKDAAFSEEEVKEIFDLRGNQTVQLLARIGIPVKRVQIQETKVIRNIEGKVIKREPVQIEALEVDWSQVSPENKNQFLKLIERSDKKLNLDPATLKKLGADEYRKLLSKTEPTVADKKRIKELERGIEAYISESFNDPNLERTKVSIRLGDPEGVESNGWYDPASKSIVISRHYFENYLRTGNIPRPLGHELDHRFLFHPNHPQVKTYSVNISKVTEENAELFPPGYEEGFSVQELKNHRKDIGKLGFKFIEESEVVFNKPDEAKVSPQDLSDLKNPIESFETTTKQDRNRVDMMAEYITKAKEANTKRPITDPSSSYKLDPAKNEIEVEFLYNNSPAKIELPCESCGAFRSENIQNWISKNFSDDEIKKFSADPSWIKTRLAEVFKGNGQSRNELEMLSGTYEKLETYLNKVDAYHYQALDAIQKEVASHLGKLDQLAKDTKLKNEALEKKIKEFSLKVDAASTPGFSSGTAKDWKKEFAPVRKAIKEYSNGLYSQELSGIELEGGVGKTESQPRAQSVESDPKGGSALPRGKEAKFKTWDSSDLSALPSNTNSEFLKLNPAEIQRLVNESKIKAIHPLDVSSKTKVYVVELENGMVGIYKPDARFQPKIEGKMITNASNEIGASAVDYYYDLGLVPPTLKTNIFIWATHKGMTEGSFQLFRPGLTQGKAFIESGGKINPVSAIKAEILDTFLDQSDRHLNNFLVDGHGNIVAIDNGSSFAQGETIYNKVYSSYGTRSADYSAQKRIDHLRKIEVYSPADGKLMGHLDLTFSSYYTQGDLSAFVKSGEGQKLIEKLKNPNLEAIKASIRENYPSLSEREVAADAARVVRRSPQIVDYLLGLGSANPSSP